MLQRDKADDYVIATGETNTLEDFVAAVFETQGLDWHDHVMSDPTLIRPSEIMVSCGDASKAARELGWCAHFRMRDVARMMIE